MSTETMLHPFNNTPCEVKHLNPGDLVEAGDIYRSSTMVEEKSALGRWFEAGAMLAGSVIGPACPIHFIRLIPVKDAKPVARTDGKAPGVIISRHGQR